MKRGFTLVELLTVLAIITLLVGLLVPSMAMIRRVARETSQRAMLVSIGAALTTFRNDYGDYPPSDGWDTTIDDTSAYTGTQKLTEALLGWDLMGFHPRSHWYATGTDSPLPGGTPIYESDEANLTKRRGRYLELATVNVLPLGTTIDRQGIYDIPDTNPLYDGRDTYVLCDVFPHRRLRINDETVRVGAPILYYKANPSSKLLRDGPDLSLRMYQAWDNVGIVVLEDMAEDGALGQHPLGNPADEWGFFYNYIQDPRVIAASWPHRPDSYLLITAGHDGIYGTADDITNFGR